MHIGIADNCGKLSIICEVTKTRKDRIYFYVINGNWDGSIKDGILHVNCIKKKYPANIVWKGNIPNYALDAYSKAFEFVRKKLIK